MQRVTSASNRDVEFEVEGQIARAGNQNDSRTGLSFGFLAAAVVLFIVFGSLFATALPLVTAAMSIGTSVAIIGLLSHVVDMGEFSASWRC